MSAQLWSLLFLLFLWTASVCIAEKTLAEDTEQSMLLYLWLAAAPVLFFILYCICGFWWMYAIWHIVWKVATFHLPSGGRTLAKERSQVILAPGI